MLHGRLADPVHARIATDSLVARIDKDDLVEFVSSILVDPVRVKDAQVGAATTNTFFSNGLEVTSGLELVHTMTGRLTIDGTLSNLALTTTTSDTDAIDDETLLGLVSETTGLVDARRTAGTMDDVELTVFPATDTEDEAKDIRLLLLVELFNVFIGAHTLE